MIRALVLSSLLFAPLAHADGTINFSNRNLPDPLGALYNVPIWQQSYDGSKVGAGILSGGVHVGLFKPGASYFGPDLLAETTLRTDSPANAAFFANRINNVDTGYGTGARGTLIVRAWQGESYEIAHQTGLQLGQWEFTSAPLGGPFPGPSSPEMTGWGPSNGQGLWLDHSLEIWGAIQLSNRSVPTASGAETYDIPIWVPGGVGSTGAGVLPGGVNVALVDNGLIMAVTRLGEGSGLDAAYFTAKMAYSISPPGSSRMLTLRVWQGPIGTSWSDATGSKGEITFQAMPLGFGIPRSNTPGLTGLGSESGWGFVLDPTFGLIEAPEPSSGILVLGGVLTILVFKGAVAFRMGKTAR